MTLHPAGPLHSPTKTHTPPHPSPRPGLRYAQSVSQAGNGRAAGKLFQERVADIAEILDSDFAGEESVGGELAQESEKFNALAQAGILFRILAVGDEIKNFFLLRLVQSR